MTTEKGEVVIPPQLLGHKLGTATYTIIDPTVRKALTDAGQDFSVSVRDGSYEFPPSSLLTHYDTVRVDTSRIAYGDLNGDDIPDALIPVTVGTDEKATVELAAFTASGSSVRQFAAFPLGQATVKTFSITKGKIRVNFTHMLAGDPGPRNTELQLELPRK